MEIDDFNYVVIFDTESSSFNRNKAQIIEIGAIRIGIENNKVDGFNRLIKLSEGNYITKEAEELHGISSNMLIGAKCKEEVLLEFGNYIDNLGTLLVAYNLSFDKWFIDKEFKEIGYKLKNELYTLDAMSMYRKKHGSPYKLSSAIKKYNLSDKVNNNHRALGDANATFELLKCMLKDGLRINDFVREYIKK